MCIAKWNIDSMSCEGRHKHREGPETYVTCFYQEVNRIFISLYIHCLMNTLFIKCFIHCSWINIYLYYISEKAMAPHYSTLAWKIPWAEEPGRLQSIESLGVGHDWVTSPSLFTFMHWRRKWQPTPTFLPGESQGGRSLVGCRLWGRTKLDMTEVT